MDRFLRKFERVTTIVLIAMLAAVVAASVAQLAWMVLKGLGSPTVVSFDTDRLLDVFGAFLLVLIGVELLETLVAYVHDHELRAELIVLVAVIALARKLITLDLSAQSSGSLLGLAALIGALSLAYFLLRRTHVRATDPAPPAARS